MQPLSTRWAVALLTVACLQVLPVRAGERGGTHEERQQARLEQMRTRLGLSDEQAARVADIFAAARQQSEADRAAAGDDRQALTRLGRARHRDVRRQIEALLTPEQKTRQEAWRREHREQVDKRERHYEQAAPTPGR